MLLVGNKQFQICTIRLSHVKIRITTGAPLQVLSEWSDKLTVSTAQSSQDIHQDESILVHQNPQLLCK